MGLSKKERRYIRQHAHDRSVQQLAEQFGVDAAVIRATLGESPLSGGRRDGAQALPDSSPIHQRDMVAVVAYAAVVVMACVYLLVGAVTFREIRFDLTDPGVARGWTVEGGDRQEQGGVGWRIEPRPSALVLSPSMSAEGGQPRHVRWREYPYVTLECEPAPWQRTITFVWRLAGHGEDDRTFPVDIPAHRRSFVINTQAFAPWIQRGPLVGPIGRFGFMVDDEIVLQRVSLQSSLSLPDRFRLLLGECSQVEPVYVYSINLVAGLVVFGVPLIRWLGLLVLCMALIHWWRVSRLTVLVLVGSACASVIVLDAVFCRTLAGEVRYAAERSAWHRDLYDEQASRFGREFAQLARVFRERVPVGSKVFFPWSKQWPVRGESNWIYFQMYPQYQPAALEDADYVLYFYPQTLLFNRQQNVVYQRDQPSREFGILPLYVREAQVAVLQVSHD